MANSSYLELEVLGDRATIDGHNAPLRQILSGLAEKSGIKVVARDDLSEPITISVYRVPFEKALATLLRERSYVLRLVAATGATDSIVVNAMPANATLYVLSKRQGSASSLAAVRLVEQLGVSALTDFDPLVRYQAVDALGEIGDERAIAFLQQALTDEEVDVREAAIDALGYIGGDEAASALAIALDDENATLREEAVAALRHVAVPTTIALLQQASADSNCRVRDAANVALSELASDGY